MTDANHEQHAHMLESLANVLSASEISLATHDHLSCDSADLARQLWEHLAAFNSVGDVVPYFGDDRLPYSEASHQLITSMSMAYHGFYLQAFASLRTVCELSLLQCALSEASVENDRAFNEVTYLGARAEATPLSGQAHTLHGWAVEGRQTPRWQNMLKQVLDSESGRSFDSSVNFEERVTELMLGLNQYVHVRGWRRASVNIANWGLSFSPDTFSQYATRMMCTTQVSLSTLMLTFLPESAIDPSAAAGYLDPGDFLMATRVLPATDSRWFQTVYARLHGVQP